MLKLRFTGGGPMDGARLLSNGSLPDAAGDWPTVFYEWVSGPDHW